MFSKKQAGCMTIMCSDIQRNNAGSPHAYKIIFENNSKLEFYGHSTNSKVDNTIR